MLATNGVVMGKATWQEDEVAIPAVDQEGGNAYTRARLDVGDRTYYCRNPSARGSGDFYDRPRTSQCVHTAREAWEGLPGCSGWSNSIFPRPKTTYP